MRQRKISVIIPSMFRANQFRECIKRVQETTQNFDIEMIVVVDGRCEDTLYEAMLLPNVLTIFNERHLGAIKSWNRGLRVSSGDIIVAIGDDCFCWDHWLDEALAVLETLPNQSGVVGLNAVYDDGYRADHCSHFLTTRRCIKEVLGGCLFYECYHHFFSDNETLQRARRVNQYAAATEAKVEHRHYRLGKAPNDPVYTLPLCWAEEDKALFARREIAGFPNDFEAIIK